jgi:hypothetical protein
LVFLAKKHDAREKEKGGSEDPPEFTHSSVVCST